MPTLTINDPATKSAFNARVDRYPDTCPACRKGIVPTQWFALRKNLAPGPSLQALFQCPISFCESFFIATYRKATSVRTVDFILDASFLTRFSEEIGVSDTIQNISPLFSVIYSQASIAEQNDLDQICGPGYRRALEFLIKDYLIHIRPDDADQIKRTLLAPLINTIDDPRIKRCATRAAWLGNDETHYIRRWDAMDLSNLKDLITLTLHYIEAEELSRKYEQEMPQGKK